MTVIEAIRFGSRQGNDLEVTITLHGEPEAVLKVLVHGLPREALEAVEGMQERKLSVASIAPELALEAPGDDDDVDDDLDEFADSPVS